MIVKTVFYIKVSRTVFIYFISFSEKKLKIVIDWNTPHERKFTDFSVWYPIKFYATTDYKFTNNIPYINHGTKMKRLSNNWIHATHIDEIWIYCYPIAIICMNLYGLQCCRRYYGRGTHWHSGSSGEGER